jgi:hypothetical protein
MRQGQQNRRGRGRSSSSGRKSQNPLTRSFESTGPDIKIRGTPAHIAEKYISLARDASSSGDPVLSENYLQHAEHYNRIIMTFREQQISQGGEGVNGAVGRPRQFSAHESAETGEGFDVDADRDMRPPHPPARLHEPQPRVEGYRGGQEQSRPRGRSDRQERGGSRGSGRGGRPSAEASNDVQPPSAEGQSSGREGFAEGHEQPEFLRRPVRRPRRDSNGGSTEANGGAVTDDADRD